MACGPLAKKAPGCRGLSPQDATLSTVALQDLGTGNGLSTPRLAIG